MSVLNSLRLSQGCRLCYYRPEMIVLADSGLLLLAHLGNVECTYYKSRVYKILWTKIPAPAPPVNFLNLTLTFALCPNSQNCFMQGKIMFHDRVPIF